MRYLSILTLFSLLSINPLMIHAAPVRNIVPKGAISYTSKSQKFSIWLPKKPDEWYTDLRLKHGEKGRSYSFEALSTEVSYSLMSFSKAGLSKAAQGGGLHEMQSSIIRSWDSTLQKREDLKLGGFAGRELTLNTALDAPVRVRLFDTPRFNYVILARSDKALTPKQNVQINRVFDSFRILK